MSTLYRLTPERLGDILETEDKAIACFNDNYRVIGVELPLPEGMVDDQGRGTQTALYGDRVGKDKYGHWIVVADRSAEPTCGCGALACEICTPIGHAL